jgi:acetyl-CoA acetyltransferase
LTLPFGFIAACGGTLACGGRLGYYPLGRNVMEALKDQTAIVGVGHTEYSRDSGRSEISLAVEAIRNAIDDAGLKPADIDGIARYTMDNNDPVAIAANLGIPALRFFGEAHYGGGGGPVGSVLLGAMAVATGMANHVVAFRAMNERSGRGTPRFGRAQVRDGAGGGRAYHEPYGLFSPAQMVALAARRHMHLYGTRSEHFGAIALACRAHAQNNPRAVMRGRPLTMEDHQNSRMIADPLRLHDCCLETDGGAAVLITTAERARDLKHRPAYIMAGAFGATNWNTQAMIKFLERPESESTIVARALFARAEITHKDIDVCFIYDHFTPLVLMAFEELGFCKRGEGGPFVSDGKLLWPHGSLPLNTSGGNLSEGYIHGMQNTIEAVRQLRGQAINQVKDARHAFIASGNGVPNTAMILRN